MKHTLNYALVGLALGDVTNSDLAQPAPVGILPPDVQPAPRNISSELKQLHTVAVTGSPTAWGSNSDRDAG